jgi:hypothetical protein
MNEVDYMRSEEEVGVGGFLQEMATQIMALQGSRCGDFIVGFGGRDADLDDGGCTGIVELVGVDGEDRTLVKVAGHKTFSHDGVEPDQLEAHRESLVSELFFEGQYEADGDSEGITASFVDTIAVPHDEDPDAHAAGIFKAAMERCEVFSASMRRVSESMNGDEGD